MIDAQLICDSISPQKHRLTTFKLKYPRFIHSEFMTHRALSRNASSSRAIPFAKQVQQVRDDATRAAPVYWGAEQKGMQAGEELSDIRPPGPTTRMYMQEASPLPSPKESVIALWRAAALNACDAADQMAYLGLHKSICNRIIEPYTHITVIASATDAGWMNFLGLRLDAAAEPTMRALAVAMWEAYRVSKPQLLQPGQWHLPFCDIAVMDKLEMDAAMAAAGNIVSTKENPTRLGREALNNFINICIKVSVARCARVSFESFDTGKRSTVEEDLKLYDRLVGAQPLHASPAEHQATPDYHPMDGGWTDNLHFANQHQHGNLMGWRQYRKMLPGEAVAPLPKEYT